MSRGLGDVYKRQEKEYENSYLIVVANPSPDMEEKYTNRMIISKKACETAE